MANWLQKIQPQAKNRNLPAQRRAAFPVSAPAKTGTTIAGLPSASVVYAIAASALFVIAAYFFVGGAWLNGALVMLPAISLLGFAIHFLKDR